MLLVEYPERDMDYRKDSFEILRQFLTYHESIKGHSKRTVDEYYLDLRNFFRFMKLSHDLVPSDTPFNEITIADVDFELVKNVALSDVYDYMSYLNRDRPKRQNSSNTDYGLLASSRARKIASIRSFYKYLTSKANLLAENPLQNMDSPRIKKSLPRYLDLEQSVNLLSNIEGMYAERDFCIITLFLNCGLRVSELTGMDLSDIREDHLRVLGKGNKERIVYLNDACVEAINAYLAVRPKISGEKALFISRNNRRLSRSAVNLLVKKHISAAGIDSSKYSSHKLRHTAATLMLKNGVDVRTLQELLGHEHLNTTQIYTHIDNENLRTAARANPLSKVQVNKKTQKKDIEE